MNGKTEANQDLRRTGVLIVAAAVAALATACGAGGSSSSSAGSDSAESATYRHDVSFVQCLRSHGEPNFPEPRPGHPISVQESGTGGSSGPLAQAVNSCQNLLPRGSSTTSTGTVTPQQFGQAVKVVQCLRSHGEPNFSDPKVVDGSLSFSAPPGLIQSAQFQTALNACRSLLPKGFQP